MSTSSVFRSQPVICHSGGVPAASEHRAAEEATQADGDRGAPVNAESS